MDVVHDLLFTVSAVEKLGRRGISEGEAQQLVDAFYLVLRNPKRLSRYPWIRGVRRLMLGTTAGGRTLTLVIEPTLEPTDWLVVTGWNSANHERRMLRR